MSLLFMVLGAVVLFIAGKPIVDYALSYGSMIIVKGAPGYLQDGELVKPIVQSGSTVDQSEIHTPALNTQYAVILCDQIALSAPLYYGDNSYSLQNGVGQYSYSGLPGEGKPILIGGHDGTFFAPLKDIKIGDMIEIETTYGNYEYQVSNTSVADIDNTDAYDLNQNKEQLILYTCYPFGQLIGDRDKRFFVYCDLVSGTTQDVK